MAAVLTASSNGGVCEDEVLVGEGNIPSGYNESIPTKLTYYVRDSKHEHEKGYEIRYDTGGVIPDTNTSEEVKAITVTNFRPIQSEQTFQTYGFKSARIDCSLSAQDYDDSAKVENVYYPAVLDALKKEYPDAGDIRVLEHRGRKRHQRFPVEELYEFLQPSTIAHIDFTRESASRTCQAAFQQTPEQYTRLLTVNVWKCLHGPGNDWPLALCDMRTLNRGVDSMGVDIVYHDRYTESEGLHYHPQQRWFYVKDLGVDEIIIFQQTDSTSSKGGGVAHASFFNPEADQDAAPRSSIELRAFVFFY